MTSPDSYPGSNPSSSSSKGSRFSSLKVFGKILKERDTLKPPAPPPKDTYYLNNRSLVSLQYPQQESYSSPQTPYSSSPYSSSNSHPIGSAYGTTTTNSNMNYARSQYAPSVHSKRPQLNAASSSLSLASSSSLVSSPSDVVPSPSNTTQPPSAKSKKSGFFTFNKKGVKSPSSSRKGTVDETMSLHSTGEDGNISTPWNFQHNIHVDDALVGLPPSWTVSLAKAGFTEEEIAAIYARKQAGTLTPAGDLPPQAFGGYERPRSPAISIASSAASARPATAASSVGSFGSSVAPSPVLAHPLPRSTSLPRNQSNEDARQTIIGLPAPSRLYSPAPSLSSQQQPQQRPTHNNVNLSLTIPASELSRMKPNAVAVQGDEEAIGATVLPEHHKRTTSTSSRGPSRAPSLKSRKESPKIQPPPFNGVSGSSQTSPVSRPSTPPRRAYFVANSQTPAFTSPPPSYSSANGKHPNMPYPSDKAGARHHQQPSTDSSRSGQSSGSQRSPSRRSPSRANGHQYSKSSASHHTYSSTSSGGGGEPELMRSMSVKSITTPTSSSKTNKRRSKRNFEGLNLSLDLGLDSWGDSLMKAIPSASPTQLAFELKSDTTTTTTRSRAQSNVSSSSFLGEDETSRNTNRDTIKPTAPQQSKSSVLDRPRPKPPAPAPYLPPRVNIISDDSPLSSASPSASTFSPSPSVTTFQGGLATSPLRNMSFTEGQGEGHHHDEFPVSPGFMSDYAPSVASVSPRTGLFDEIAGMVGIRLDEEDAARLSPVTATGKSGRGRGSGGTRGWAGVGDE